MEENIKKCSVDNKWVEYFHIAKYFMSSQWDNIIYPKIKTFNFDVTLDLACGDGRNSQMLAPMCKTLYCVDLNEYSIELAKKNLNSHIDKIIFIKNNGFDLRDIPDKSVTAIYSFDSAVHFDREVIKRYVSEFKRIMMPGAKGFIHHSNYGNTNNGCDKSNIDLNPHWRTDFTYQLFASYCRENNLRCDEQHMLQWGNDASLDCISIFSNPI